MPIIDLVSNNRPFQIFHEVAAPWADTVILFFSVPHPENPDKISGFGSGFVAQFGGRLYLVTALHVIEASLELQRSGVDLGLILLKRKIPLISKYYRPWIISRHDDLAASPLRPHEIQSWGVKKTSEIPVMEHFSRLGETGVYSVLGHPASQNKLHGKFDNFERKIAIYAACERVTDIPFSTKLRSPIGFKLKKKYVPNSEGQIITAPDTDGISGGPVFELLPPELGSVMDGFGHTVPHFPVKLAGVFIGWDWKSQVAYASPTGRLIELLKLCEEKIFSGENSTVYSVE